MRAGRRLLVAIAVVLAASAVQARQWTSRDGGFSVEAELVDVQSGKVVLKRTDGVEVSVPLEKLSLRDVRYVEQTLKEAEKAVLGESKTAESPPPRKPAPAEPPRRGADRRAGPPLAQADSSDWQVRPDPPLEPFTLPANAKVAIPLGGGYSLEVVYPTAPSPFVMIASRGSEDLAEVYDLRTGKRSGRIAHEIRASIGRALSPDGTRLAVSESYPQRGVFVWSFRTGQIEKRIEFEDSSWHVMYLDFAGPDRVFAPVSGTNGVVIWDLDTEERIAEYKTNLTPDKNGFAVSPGGNYIAMAPITQHPRIIDARNGVEAGRLQADSRGGAGAMSVVGMAFSPDGAELAGLFQDSGGAAILVWDMASGELAVEHRLEKSPTQLVPRASSYQGKPLEWLADRSGWLLYGAAVADRVKGGPIWVDTADDDILRVPRRIVDATRMFAADGQRGSQVLRLVSIPKEKIAEGAKVVAAGGTATDASLPPLTKADASTAKEILLRPASVWSYTPKAAAARPLTTGPVSLDLNVAEVRQVLFAAPEAAKAIVATSPRSRVKSGKVVSEPRVCARYDLRSGKRLDEFAVPIAAEPLDLSPDGSRVLCRLEDGRDRLDIFSLDAQSHELGFRPYLGLGSLHESIAWAAMVDDQHLLTSNALGLLIAWKLPECKANWSLELRGGPKALSLDRRTLAVCDETGRLNLIDTQTGRLEGRLDHPDEASSRVISAAAFRADAAQLAATFMAGDDALLVVWDLKSGKVASSFWLPASSQFLRWAGPRHVLVRQVPPPEEKPKPSPGTTGIAGLDPTRFLQPPAVPKMPELPPLLLVDLDRGMVMWKYQASYSPPIDSPDGRYWYVASREILAAAKLVPADLPEKEILRTIAAAAPPQPILAPRSQVKLSVKLDLAGKREGSDKVQARLEQAFRAMLEKGGFLVDEKAAIAMKVVLKEWIGEEELRLHTLRGGAMAVHPLEIRCEISVGREGKDAAAWTQATKITPDDRDRVFTEDKDRELPDYFRSMPWLGAIAWCEDFLLPSRVYPDAAYAGLGQSRLTQDGPIQVREK